MGEPAPRSARDPLKPIRELLAKARGSTQKAIDKAAPVVQKSLDSSLDATTKAFTRTMKTIDGATAGDQARLFRAYRKVLAGQLEFVDARIRAIEEKSQAHPPAAEAQPQQ